MGEDERRSFVCRLPGGGRGRPGNGKTGGGASSPLVLKGGGLGKDGSAEDVEARIVVSEYRDALPAEAEWRRGKKLLRLEVEADVPLSIRGMELQTTDGIPLAVSEDWECGRLGGSWDINPVEEGELRVLVRHSQNLRRCKALMDSRMSLAGLVRGGMERILLKRDRKSLR